MPKFSSTTFALLSVLAGFGSLGRLSAQSIFNYSNGIRTAHRATTTANPFTGATAAGIVATEAGVISGDGTFTKTGPGYLLFTADNTYTGGTTISAGTLALSGATNSSSFTLGAGTILDFQVASGTRDALASTTTFTGAGTLLKSGAGTLLWGANSAVFAFSAGAKIIVQAGAFAGGYANENWTANYADLEVGANARLLGVEANVRVNTLTGAGRITSGYTGSGYQNFTFGVANGSGTFSGVLANDDGGHSGNYVKTGTGTQILTGANTYTGTTTISGGTLQIGDGGASGSLLSSKITNSAALIFNRTGASGFAGIIEGTGTLTKLGTGTLTLAGANTYTGNTTISGGTLILADTTHSPAFAIAAGAALDFQVASGTRDALVATTTFTGAGTLIKSGAGTLIWSANSGVFALSAGAKISVQAGLFVGGSNATENWTNNYADLEIATGALFLGAEANVRVNALTGAGRVTSGYSGAGYENFTFGVGNGSGTFSGVLADDDGGFAGHYVKTGTGTQILTGANTYTGTTAISDGTLQIGDGGDTGSLASSKITNHAALVFNRVGPSAYAGVIEGTGTLTKLGTDALTLSGANTYTGDTTISDGTLALSGPTNSSVFTLGSGAVLDYQVNSGGRDASAATTTFTGTGTLLKSGAGTLGWVANSAVFALSSGAKINVQAGTFAAGGFANDNWTANQADLEVANGALFIGAEANVRVNALTGDGGITSGYSGAGYQNFTFGVSNGSGTFSGILANDDAGFIGHYVKTGTGTQILTGTNTYTGTTTISGGTLQIGDGGATGSLASGTITNNSALVFNRVGTSTFAGLIQGTGTLAKLGDGTLTLSGDSTGYTGATTISAGTLILGTSTALGTTGAIAIASGATLDQSTHTADLSRFSGAGTLTGSSLFNYNSATDHSLAAILAGPAGLDKKGAGILTLSGISTYTGTTTIHTGSLIVSGTLGSGNYAGNIANASNLAFASDSNQTLSGVLSGSGTLTKIGTGTLTLSGASTYTGNTTISSGTLTVSGTLGAGAYSGNIANAGALIFSSASHQTLSGILSGSGSLTKSGTGTLTLSGDNTNYTGATTIASGTLALGRATALGSNGGVTIASGATFDSSTYGADLNHIFGAGTLTGSGTYSFNSNTDTARATVLAGSASLIKYGNSSLTLSGANTYTGTTTISGGELTLGANNVLADTTAVTIQSNAFLEFDGFSDTIGSLAGAGYVNLRAGTLTVGGDNTSTTFSGVVRVGTGTLDKSGTGTLTLSGRNSYTGATTISGGTLVLQNGTDSASFAIASGAVLDLNAASGNLEFTNPITYSGAGTLRKTGAGSVLWGPTGTFALAAGSLIDVQAGTFVGTNGNENWTNNLSDLHVASGATFNGSGGNIRIDALSGAGTVNLGNSSFTLGVDGGSGTFSGTLVEGGISGTLIKTGTGTQTLSGANTFSGGTTINGGLINFSSLANFGPGSVTVNGGGLQWATGTFTDISSRLAALGINGATFDTNGNNVTFASALSGDGALTKSGAGSLTLSGVNAYAGNTTISAGTLHVTGTLGSGAYAGAIANAGVLTFTSASDQALAGVISGTGSLAQSGTGTLALAGTNTYGGGTTLNAGTIKFSDAANFGTGAITLNGGILQWVENTAADLSARLDALVAATFDLNGNDVTFGSALSGTGSLTKVGDGTLTLAGANTYTGTTAISGGTLDVAGTLGSGSYAAAIANAGTLTFSGSSGQTLSGIISGSGNLTKSGAGTLTLSGANTYTGGTTVAGGLVNFASLANFGTGSVSLNGGGLQWATGTSTDASARLAALGTNGATLDTNGNDVTFASALFGSGALTKTGAGTLTLSGTNTHSGGTTVAGGLVNFSSLGNFGTGNVALNGGGLQWGLYNYTDVSSRLAPFGPNGATFDTNGKDIIFASALSGSGGLTKSGDGRLRLSAANSYTGTTTINGGSILLLGTATLGSGATILNGTGSLYLSGTTASAGNGNFTLNGDAPDIGTGTRITFAAANVSGTFTVNGGTIDTAGSGTLEFLTGTAGTATITNNAAMGSGYGGRTLFSGSSRAADSTITNNGSTVAGAQAGGTEFHGTAIAERATLIANGGSNGGAGGLISFSANSNGNVSTVKVYGNGTLDISLHDPGFVSVGSLEGTGQVNLGSNNLYVGYHYGNVTTNASTVFSGIIQGAGGSLTKFGTGTFTLSGENTYSGGTTIYGGMVNFARLANFGTGTVTVMSGGLQWAPGNTSDISSRLSAIGSGGATFDTNGNNVTFASGLSGSGRVTKAGTGTLTLSGNNTYTGGTTITGGIVNFSSLGSGTVTLNGGGLQWASGSSTAVSVSLGAGGGTFDTNGNDVTLTGSLSGSGGITKSGAGTLTFSAGGYYTGNTTINSGTLRFSGPLNTYAGNIANAGTLVVSHPSASYIFSGVISGSGNLVNSAYLTLAGVNTYTGNTVSNGSYLKVTGTLGAGNYAGDIAVSSLLVLSSSADQLLSGVISGTAQLTKNGSGTLTLTGANVYSGVTFIDAGTLVLSGGDNRLPTGKFVTISNGATLDLGGYSQELNLPSVTAISLRVNSGTVTAGTIKSNGTVSITAGTLANTWEGTGLLRIGGDANATVYLNGTNNSERVGTTSQLYIGDASTAGIVKIGNANALLAASQDALIYRGTLDLNGQTEVRGHGLIFMNGSTASLVNGSTDHAASFLNSISLTTGLANIGGAGQLTLGPVSGNGGFTKIGTGTLTLSGANTYAGGTTVNAGTLAAGSTTAFGSSTVRVDAGTLNLGGFAVTNALDVRGGTLTGLANYAGTQTLSTAMNYAGTVGGSMVIASGGALNTTGATFTGATTVNSGGRLSGTGSLGNLTLASGSTLSPGNSPGTLSVTGNAMWNGGANYAWEINDATGVAGTNYDLVSISGSLTLAATAGNKFTLSLLSLLTSNDAGDVINFDAAQNSSYTIASATGGIFGFDANAFTINTNGFTNALNGGSWNLSQVGNNLNLNFAAASAIPEPSTYAALFGALVLALAIYRKRSRR